MSGVRIVEVTPDQADRVRRLGELLVEGFAHFAPHPWPDATAGEAEVRHVWDEAGTALAALDENEAVLGWVGALPQYDGNVWEMHPLVVDVAARGSGVGLRLVAALEERARAAGAQAIWLGADDLNAATSVGGIELFPNVLAHLAHLADVWGHPVGFYRRAGYEVVGIIPHANGFGKPDILMAKSLHASVEAAR